MPHQQTIDLEIPFQIECLPLATGCVEQATRIYGFGKAESMHLALAVEELFSFLSRRFAPGHRLNLSCRNAGYYAEVVCRFQRGLLPVEAFNITATISPDDDKSLEQMGLLLAARTVDRLQIFAQETEMAIHFIKEKKYPKVNEPISPFEVTESFQPRETEPELLKQFAARVWSCYGASAPAFFEFPGKLVDMVWQNEAGAVLLVDGKGRVGAGALWRLQGKMAEMFGPYVFCDQTRLATEILERAIARLGRSGLLCAIVQKPVELMPQGFFEALDESGNRLYRQLEEDNGAIAYVHPRLLDYFQSQLRRLVLPRQIHSVEHQGEQLAEGAAFATEINRQNQFAVLRSLWPGKDSLQVLREHIYYLRAAGLGTVYFYLDAGVPEQALLTPALLDSGFEPQWILPWGGQGDLIVLQHREEKS